MNKNPRAQFCIGMFDSGVGGLTVLKEVTHRLPHENIIYFGDTARMPYGEKSAETIIKYSIENSVFLLEHNIKMLIVACNTSASVSIDKLQKIFNIPVLGVIEAGSEKAVKTSKSGHIAVLATKGTILSKAYEIKIKEINPHAKVIPIAAPLLAPIVEEGLLDHPATELILSDYLKPVLEHSADTLLLGCTHYPLLIKAIKKIIGSSVVIVDSASTCAERAAEILERLDLQNKTHEKVSHRFYVSDSPEKFQKLGRIFFPEISDVILKR